MNTELWSHDKQFRTFTVAKGSSPNTVNVRIASGTSSMSVHEGVTRFHIDEEILLLAGYGREKWYYDITPKQAYTKVDLFRERAKKEGFTLEGQSKYKSY